MTRVQEAQDRLDAAVTVIQLVSPVLNDPDVRQGVKGHLRKVFDAAAAERRAAADELAAARSAIVTVEVYGPNLRGRNSGQFHIHRPGCADTAKATYQGCDPPWQTEVETMTDLVTDIYDPGCFDYNPDNPDELAKYAGEIKVFPCVGRLKGVSA